MVSAVSLMSEKKSGGGTGFRGKEGVQLGICCGSERKEFSLGYVVVLVPVGHPHGLYGQYWEIGLLELSEYTRLWCFLHQS